MPLDKIEKPGFVYIAYRRKNNNDFDAFKTTLETLIKQDLTIENIVIDLTRDKMLVEGEIALIAKTLQRLQGTSCNLRIIAGGEIAEKLESTNLLRINNIFAYTNHKALLEDLNNTSEALIH